MKTDYRAGQRQFAAWLADRGVRLRNTVEHGLQRDDDGWEHFAWTLTVAGAATPDVYDFDFRQGTGHTKKPTLVELMGSLFSDAYCVVDSDFADFCAELGYDTDSRKAEALYKRIQVNNGRLLRLFGGSDLGLLLKQTAPLMEAAGL